jgi:ribosome-associated protein
MSESPGGKNVPPPPGVAAEPPGDEVAPGVRVLPSAMRFQFARSGGPGGQNVNKLNTKAELWVPLGALVGMSGRALGRLRTLAGRRLTNAGEIHITAETERSQESNRAAVMERLRQLLIEAMHEPKPRRKTKPSKASKRRRLEAKKKRSEVKSRRSGGAGDW